MSSIGSTFTYALVHITLRFWKLYFLFDEGQQIISEFVFTDYLRIVNKEILCNHILTNFRGRGIMLLFFLSHYYR